MVGLFLGREIMNQNCTLLGCLKLFLNEAATFFGIVQAATPAFFKKRK